MISIGSRPVFLYCLYAAANFLSLMTEIMPAAIARMPDGVPLRTKLRMDAMMP